MIVEILPFGDSAALVKFEQRIDEKLSGSIFTLSSHLSRLDVIQFLTPAYCSILLGFDPEKISFKDLKKLVVTGLDELDHGSEEIPRRHLRIPVCYDLSLGIDLAFVSSHTQLPTDEIIKTHKQKSYSVFMIGFLPGFSYLGVLPEILKCPRKETPREKVAKGSVGIAGAQTGIYPADVPGGWQIIGRTPVPIFRPLADDPFLLRPGDQVSFFEVPMKQFEEITFQISQDNFDWTTLFYG